MTGQRGTLDRIFAWLLSHRALGLALLIALTGALGYFAGKVKPDYSVEQLFPVRDPARETYDRFKAKFPYEDTVALVVVEAPDLFTPAGLGRLQGLEKELRGMPGTLEVLGPMSVYHVEDSLLGRLAALLFPRPDLPPDEIARRRELLTRDPLYSWNVAKPDGSAVTIQIVLDPAVASSDTGRQRFLAATRQLLEKHRSPGQSLILSGVPAIRAQFAEMLNDDVGRLMPLALLAVLLLLFAAYRSVGSVLACLATIVTALVWSFGVAGILGFPLTMILSVTPIIIIVVSVSDTVHVVNEFLVHRREGLDVRPALLQTLPAVALSCLLTEVVLACGFMSLAAVNITAVMQFGIVTAIAMLLTWLANMLVLPLALSLTRGPAKPSAQAAPFAVRGFEKLLAAIGKLVTDRPGKTVAVAALVLVAAITSGLRIQKISYAFDDLRPGSEMFRNLRQAEAAHGGLIPVAIFIEARGQHGALEPELVRLADRAAAFLKSFPEIRQANSVADYVRKGRELSAAVQARSSEAREASGDGIPLSRRQIEAALLPFGNEKSHLAVVSSDRKSLAVIGGVLDVGSTRVAAMFKDIESWIAREQAAIDAHPQGPRAQIHATGQLRIFKDVNDSLTVGLAGSFAISLLVSFLAMCVVLRSWRLGLIGLVPNLVPIVLVLGFMGLAGIHLNPSTVVLFSITLVIAEDDTIQYLSRFRSHYFATRPPPGLDHHRTVALQCLREVGLPMFITSTAVSLGFLVLLLSRFLGPAHMGALLGATLFAAVFADLFLTPILLIKLRPFR